MHIGKTERERERENSRCWNLEVPLRAVCPLKEDKLTGMFTPDNIISSVLNKSKAI